MTAFTAIDLADVEAAGPGGAVRFLRRATGTAAFGFNRFTLPPDFAGPEHDEVDSEHEEVYVVLKGSGSMTVDGELVDLVEDRIVRVDATATRQMRAGPDGLDVLAIGAPIDTPYEARGPF